MGGITSLAVNPASTIAVVGGTNGGVRVVSLSKGEVISALGGHTEENSVEAIVFVNIVGAADGSSAPVGSAGAGTVVTGATDGKVCIWDLSTNRLRATLEHKVGCVVASLLLDLVVTLIHRTPSRACWYIQQNRTLLFRLLQIIRSGPGMRERELSCVNTRVTKSSSTVRRWDVMERLWSVRATMALAWYLTQNRGIKGRVSRVVYRCCMIRCSIGNKIDALSSSRRDVWNVC